MQSAAPGLNGAVGSRPCVQAFEIDQLDARVLGRPAAQIVGEACAAEADQARAVGADTVARLEQAAELVQPAQVAQAVWMIGTHVPPLPPTMTSTPRAEREGTTG